MRYTQSSWIQTVSLELAGLGWAAPLAAGSVPASAVVRRRRPTIWRRAQAGSALAVGQVGAVGLLPSPLGRSLRSLPRYRGGFLGR